MWEIIKSLFNMFEPSGLSEFEKFIESREIGHFF